MTGVLLILQHPNVANRPCEICLTDLYDEETGEPIKSRKKDGSNRKRDSSCPPPCRTAKGCPKGTPEESRALTEQNWAAYQHYLECKATGSFPDDAIVRQNAALIRRVEEIVEQGRQLRLETMLRMAIKTT